MAIRKAYWNNAKEFIDWCTDDELKVLGQQAVKALDKRMNHYLGKFDNQEHERHVRKQKSIRKQYKQSNNI